VSPTDKTMAITHIQIRGYSKWSCDKIQSWKLSCDCHIKLSQNARSPSFLLGLTAIGVGVKVIPQLEKHLLLRP
jgi:hypothetical protein